jgi:hypothetical protein
MAGDNLPYPGNEVRESISGKVFANHSCYDVQSNTVKRRGFY